MDERSREGRGIMVLLVMDVKGLKLNVIRTTRFYSIFYMDTMEGKEGTAGTVVLEMHEI